MPFEFKFPDVGEGIQEGELKKWLVEEGSPIKADQHLAQVETDKAVVEMPSPKSGVIQKLHFKEGDTIQVGQVFVTIALEGEAQSSESQPQLTPEPKTEQPAQVSTEQKPEPKKEETSDKPKEKYTGSVVGFLEEAKEVTPLPQPTHQASTAKKEVKATLMVRQLAKQKGVDLTTITGTGHEGLITKEDVEKASTQTQQTVAEQVQQKEQQRQAPSPTKHVRKYDFYGYLDRKPLKGLGKKIAEHMTESLFSAPQVTNHHWADITHLEELRAQKKKEQPDVKLTTLSFIVKAVAKALPNHPHANSILENNEIVVKKYYNIGIAVDFEGGLMVPVIKRANTKEVTTIAQEIVDLATKVRDRSIDLMDMKGGTFTISNLGSLGVEFFTPILNSPESALLGVGTTKETPVVKDGQIVVRKMMPLSLTFDHRIIDGGEAARFIKEVINYLEFPGSLDN